MTKIQYIFFLVYFSRPEWKFHGAGILNVLFTSISPTPNMEPVINKQVNQMWVVKEPPVL